MSEPVNSPAMLRRLLDRYGDCIEVRRELSGNWTVEVSLEPDLCVAAEVDPEVRQVRMFLGRFTLEGLTPGEYEAVLTAVSAGDFALRRRRLTGTLELRIHGAETEQIAYAPVGKEGLEAWEQRVLGI